MSLGSGAAAAPGASGGRGAAASIPLSGTYVQLLLRGLVAGLVAGLLAGAVAFFLGEPHVDSAIAYEESHSAVEAPAGGGAAAGGHAADAPAAAGAHASGHDHGEEELISRTGQKGGLILATALAGVALGAIFASVVHFARRHSTLPGWTTALTIAGLGWLAIEAVPFIKYPANPPAVGDPDTIAERNWLWLASAMLGLLAVTVAVMVAKALRGRGMLTLRAAAPVAAFVVVVAVGCIVLPGVDEVPDDFPAALLWEFRVSSLAVQATLWALLGGVFALLTERHARKGAPASAAVPV